MLAKLLPILAEHIPPRDTIIVAVSGGPDSTALLDIIVSTTYNLQLNLIIAHINHGIRGKASDRDEKFVRELAKSHGLKCEVKLVKLAGKSGLEERGRNIRRDFFEKLRKKYRARFIVTAHTQDDQLETIVFNFLRGSGPAGLAGMKMADGFYFKPFLETPKSEILAYLRAKKIKYCKDATNEDTAFRRNFVRKKILPLFTTVNPSFRQTLLRNRKNFERIEAWMKEVAQQFLAHEKSPHGLFSRKAFLKLPKALQSAAIEAAYQRESGSPYRLPFSKVEEIARLLNKGIGNKRIECGEGNEFILKKGNLFFRQQKRKIVA